MGTRNGIAGKEITMERCIWKTCWAFVLSHLNIPPEEEKPTSQQLHIESIHWGQTDRAGELFHEGFSHHKLK